MGDDALRGAAGEAVAAVRERAPLVHCVTAAVSMSTVANALLAAGARPMMTETAAEGPSMTAIADALLVNVGTLSTDGAKGIPAILGSRPPGLPWVLDPAAVGVGPVRTQLALAALGERPSVVRGNASEVLVLAGAHGAAGRGPDASRTTDEAARAAAELARRTGGAVAVSGAVDVVTDAATTVRLANGHPLLPRVTGTGCLLGALTAACCAVAEPFVAAVAATTWLGLAAEWAAPRSQGPGTFAVHLLDGLAAVTPRQVVEEMETR